MSTEPNNRMDEMLKAYAKRRREQAGPSLELHPATRNLLQAEVARSLEKAAPEAKQEPAWLQVWWPRLAWGSCIAAVMVLGAFILLQNQPAPKPTLQLAKGTDLQAPAETAPSAELPALQTAETVAEERSGKAGGPGATPRSARSRAESPAPEAATDLSYAAPAPKDALSDSRDANLALATKPAATASPAAQPAAQPVSMAGQESDRAAHADAYAYFGVQSNQVRQRFSQVASPYRRNFNSPLSPNVLNSFQVEQIGRQVRIVDADGSVYEPQIEAEPAIAMEKLDEISGAEAAAKRRAPTQKAAQTAASTDASRVNEPAGLFFRVAGTNRTLNQKVFFEGNYLVQTSSPAFGLRTPTRSAPQAAAAQIQSQPPLPTARIQGQAVIGASNRFEVNAVPIPP